MDRNELRIFRAERGLAVIQAIDEIIQDTGALAARCEAQEARCVELERHVAVLAQALGVATREVERLRAAALATLPVRDGVAPGDAG